MSNPDVLVVGGGIGGLATAYSLSRQGLTVRVLEQAAEFGEVGAGIQLAPNCTRILDDFGLLGEAIGLGVVPDAMVMRAAVEGGELTRLDVVHEAEMDNSKTIAAVSGGWPRILSNLKTLLETGDVLPQAPWEMPPDPEGERTSS